MLRSSSSRGLYAVNDAVQCRARTHCCCRFFFVGQVVPTDIDRLTLSPEKLGENFFFIADQRLCGGFEACGQPAVVDVCRDGFGPVTCQKIMAATIVDFVDLARRCPVFFEVMAVCFVERCSNNSCLVAAGLVSDIFDRHSQCEKLSK